MSADAHYVRVGLFVLAGVAAVLVAVVVLAGESWWSERRVFETTFDESVQGLDVGSPVKLRGVPLGRVTAIGLVADYYALPERARARYGQKVLVRMELSLGEDDAELRGENLALLMESGLRVRLAALGLTGTSYVEAEVLDPRKHPAPELPWDPEYPYIPSVPSSFEEFSSAAERIVTRVEELEIEPVLEHLDALLVTLRDRVGALDVQGAQSDVRELLEEVRATNAEIQQLIASEDLAAFGSGAREAVERLNATLGQVQGVVEGGRYDVGVALDNLRVASENLRSLSETLRAYPSLLILGEPPPEGPGAEP